MGDFFQYPAVIVIIGRVGIEIIMSDCGIEYRIAPQAPWLVGVKIQYYGFAHAETPEKDSYLLMIFEAV
jgi:hypothetical protein